MSISSKKFCSPEDVEKRNSETTTNEKEKIQKDEKETLQCVRAVKKRQEVQNLRNWPIFNLLKPEFISQIHTVMVYGDLGNRAIIVTKDKNVYNLGCTEDDHSRTGDIQTALCPQKIEELCGKNIKTFVHSLYFILALTKEGEVYFWEFKKPVSRIERSPIASTPTRVFGFNKKRIVDIACGNNHSLALTSGGKVYAWGGNNYGQIGNGNSVTLTGEPRQVKFELNKKNVVRIACGSTFNIVMTDENKLYGWGNNEKSQISIDNTSVSFTTTIASSSTVHHTSNFEHNSIHFEHNWDTYWSVPRPSNSFSFGTTLNNVPSQKYVAYPREITTISDEIVKLACGYRHTLALSRKGEIYTWGDNSHGQLGVRNQMKPSYPIMVKMPQMGKVLDIAAYGNLSVAEGYDRSIYVWGDYLNHCVAIPIRTTFSRIHDPFAYNSCRVMHKPLTVCTNIYDEEEELNILESLEAAFDDPSTSDFTIKVEGQPIHVHKVILKIRCQYFKNMFQHDWAENIQSTSDSSPVYNPSDKFSYIVYKAFLKYLYTATVDIPLENALELMELADMYCETNLKKSFTQIIKQAITVSNVAFFYNKAIEYNAKMSFGHVCCLGSLGLITINIDIDMELEEFCFQFACHHYSAVISSEEYTKLDKNTIINFTRRAAEEDVFKT